MSFFKDLKTITNDNKELVKPINKVNYLIINWFFKLYWLVDILILAIIYALTSNNSAYKQINTISFILLIASVVYNIIYLYRYFKGRSNAKYNLKNYRTQCFKGSQGIGKTSFMYNCARILGKDYPVIANCSAIIDNKFCYKLTKKAFMMKTQLPEPCTQLVQEITVYYNNLDQSKKRDEIAGSEGNLQFVRHNTNGYILADSVEMDRLLKTLEEKFGLTNKMLGQTSIKTGFFVPFIYWLMRLVNKKLPYIYWGYRRWKVQTFLSINENGYIYDLSNDVANTKNNKFVNLYYFYAFNDFSVIYHDRAYSKLYKQLPKEELKQYSSLLFTDEDVKDTGFDSISKLYDIELAEKMNIENSSVCPKTHRKGGCGENTDKVILYEEKQDK